MLSKSFSFHPLLDPPNYFKTQFCLMEKPGLGQSTFLAKHFVTASPSPNLLLIFSTSHLPTKYLNIGGEREGGRRAMPWGLGCGT